MSRSFEEATFVQRNPWLVLSLLSSWLWTDKTYEHSLHSKYAWLRHIRLYLSTPGGGSPIGFVTGRSWSPSVGWISPRCSLPIGSFKWHIQIRTVYRSNLLNTYSCGRLMFDWIGQISNMDELHPTRRYERLVWKFTMKTRCGCIFSGRTYSRYCFLACKEKICQKLTATSFIGLPEYHCANNLCCLPMQRGPPARASCCCFIKHIILPGGFKDFLCSSLFGEDSQFD